MPDDVLSSPLYNADLAPTPPDQRTWTRWHFAALWVGLAVCVPTYWLAAGLLRLGMNWRQAAGTILLGNLIVVVPLCLDGHAGAKYGIPFPVLLRASFGTSGSNLPVLGRTIVACGWFGIQTWVGGEAIYQLIAVMAPGVKDLAPLGDFIGLNAVQLGAFLAFWVLNVYFIVRGTESIKWLETIAAPFLIAVGLALLWWTVNVGGSMETVLAESAAFSEPSVAIVTDEGDAHLRVRPLDRATRYRVDGGSWTSLTPSVADLIPVRAEDLRSGAVAAQRFEFADDVAPPAGPHISRPIHPTPEPDATSFWRIFLPSLTAMVAFWATLSLNISDFTRFARSQREHCLGHLGGLPTTMAFYSFVGLAATAAALLVFKDVLIHEDAPWNPAALLGHSTSTPVMVIATVGLLVATLSANIAANVVAPANGISNLAPSRVSPLAGGLVTAVLGILMMPWKIFASTRGFVMTWLIGYGALLGPIAGIMIADYFIVRRTRLDVADLYRANGRYGRWNVRTIAIWALACLPCWPGFVAEVCTNLRPEVTAAVPAALKTVYSFGWFVGFTIAFVLQAILAKREVVREGTNV